MNIQKSGSELLGGYREKNMVARIPKGQRNEKNKGIIPIVINNVQVKQRIFDLDKPLTITQVMDELDDVRDYFGIKLKEGKKYSFQVTLKMQDIGWRSSKFSNLHLDKPMAQFAIKYQVALDADDPEAPFDALVEELIINLLPYNPDLDLVDLPALDDF